MLRVLPRDTTFVTGTTGLAACHLGGTTINTFAGIGRGEGSLGALALAAQVAVMLAAAWLVAGLAGARSVA